MNKITKGYKCRTRQSSYRICLLIFRNNNKIGDHSDEKKMQSGSTDLIHHGSRIAVLLPTWLLEVRSRVFMNEKGVIFQGHLLNSDHV